MVFDEAVRFDDSVTEGDSLGRRGRESVTWTVRGVAVEGAMRDAASDAMGADAMDAVAMDAVAMRISCPASTAGTFHFLMPLDSRETCGHADDSGNTYLRDEADRAQHR